MSLTRDIQRTMRLLVLLLICGPAQAHEARPLAVDISEQQSMLYRVAIKIPSVLPVNGLPQLAMPAFCQRMTEPLFKQERSGYYLEANYQCPQGISGQWLTMAFPKDQASVTTLFRVSLLSGEKHTQLLSTTERQWQVPEQESPWNVARQYTGMGINHIFGGIDHLLFIACLIFIATSWRRILITITGFTLAHSLTLFLSALNIVNLPAAPVEAVIALSLLFLAHEIAVNNKSSWTWRYPIAVSSSFGLLHGFGFAYALKEIGLPQTELVTALLFFNVGVELGQIAFIAALLLCGWVLHRLLSIEAYKLLTLSWLRFYGSYGIGTLAGFWFISRLLPV